MTMTRTPEQRSGRPAEDSAATQRTGPVAALHPVRTLPDRRSGVDRRGIPRGEGDRRMTLRRAADRAARQVHPRAERLAAMAIFATVAALAAAIGWSVTRHGMAWYDRLERPAFDPPDGLLQPLWLALLAVYAAAGYTVWRQTRDRAPTVVWTVALALQLAWTLVMFGAHAPGAALVVLAALWIAVLVFAILSAAHDAIAPWLVFPYLSWVTFAGVLDLAIARAN